MSNLKVEKRERENSRQLVGRFIRGLRRSGIIYRVKKSQFSKRPLSDKLKKKSALRKEELKKKYERLEKLGKTMRR